MNSVLINMNEEQYADYLLREMTFDLTQDFYYTKEAALKCVDEMIRITADTKSRSFLKRVKAIIEKK